MPTCEPPTVNNDDFVPYSQREYEGDNARSYESRRVHDEKWRREDRALVTLLQAAKAGPLRILDVPVGTGRFLPRYQEGGHSVVGVDISDEMLGVSRGRLRPKSNVTLCQGNIADLPFPDGHFDVAVCVRLLNLISASSASLAVGELARVTAGHLILGMRTYDSLSVPYQLLSRTRNRLRGRKSKLNIHPERLMKRMLDESALTLEHSVVIHRGAHRSSVYRFYLLRTTMQEGQE